MAETAGAYRVIFLVDLDAFFASVEEALNPSLRGRVVCIGGKGDERGIVSCPNYQARKHGVKTAMPLRTAARLLQGTDPVFLRGNIRLYGEYSKKVFAILEEFTPDIQQVSMDEGYLDVTDCLRYWGSDAIQLARAMKERVRKELGLTLSVGIASNKVCAKIASDLGKPDGLTVVPAGEEARFLAPLPVGRIPGVGKQTLKKCTALGIETIGQLAAVPVDQLTELFGSAGHQLHEYANGIDGRELHGPEEEKSISRAMTFSEDTGDREYVDAVLFHLTERCCRTLRKRSVIAATVSVTMRYKDFTQKQHQHTLPDASNIEEVIFPVVQELSGLLWRAEKEVRLVSVGLTNFLPSGTQATLFSGEDDKRAIVRRTMDAIQQKFGPQSIMKGKTAGLRGKLRPGRDGEGPGDQRKSD